MRENIAIAQSPGISGNLYGLTGYEYARSAAHRMIHRYEKIEMIDMQNITSQTKLFAVSRYRVTSPPITIPMME